MKKHLLLSSAILLTFQIKFFIRIKKRVLIKLYNNYKFLNHVSYEQ